MAQQYLCLLNRVTAVSVRAFDLMAVAPDAATVLLSQVR